MKNHRIIIKKSCYYSFAFITAISTIASLLGYSIRDIFNNLTWWKSFLILFVAFVFVAIILFIIQMMMNHKGFTTKINGKEVSIKTGNIFSINGLKVIPFNENFDTSVDDIIISHGSLNGQMLDNYVDDLTDLNKTIEKASQEKSDLLPAKKKGKIIYPLGRIIKYKDYLLLSMTHFNEKNEAYINIQEYELMLTNMWNEVRRTYAGRKIILPLIGSGITSMTGIKEKDNTMLLKCMLCTFRRSKFQPVNGIIIVMTQDAMGSIDMVKIKEEFKNGI